MTMLRIALRAHRVAAVAMAVLGFVATAVQGSAFKAAAGTTQASQAAFGRSIEELAPQLAYLIPLPIHPETAAGYVFWRGLGFMPVILGAWALAAATGAVRNEEERGLIELWLAGTVGRLGLVAARCAGFALSAAAVVAVTGLGVLAGVGTGSGTVGAGAVAEQGAALLGLTLACFGVGLAAAQLASTRRGAMALGGAVLLALFLLDSLARERSGLGSWVDVSPFVLYHRTTAAAPGGRFDGPATLALFVIAAVLAGLSTLAFSRRDLLAPLFGRPRTDRPAVRTPSGNPLLRAPVLSALWEQRAGLLAWLAGFAVMAAFMLSLARSTSDLFRGPSFKGYLRASGTSDPDLLLISAFWFGIAGLLMAAYAIVQVSRWAADDGEGRLEMMLAQPVPRWRVVAERCVTLGVTCGALAAAGSLTIAAGAPGQGIHLDGGRLVVATALLALLGMMFGGVGALVTARLPRAAVALLSTIAVLSFFIIEIGPLFQWPEWALDLSVFRLYGSPLTSGVYWTGLWAMAAVTVVGFGAGLAAMRFREVGR